MDPVPRNAQDFLGIVVEIDKVSQRNTWTLSGEVILQQSVWNIQSLCTYMFFFPEIIGVTPEIIHVTRIFPYKPSILGTPFMEPPIFNHIYMWKCTKITQMANIYPLVNIQKTM